MNCRHAATIIIKKISEGDASLATLIPEHLKKIPEEDHALLHELCYGSLRHYYSLRTIISGYLEKPLRSKDGDILALMIVGAYQLLYTRIPDHAAINTSVDLAEALNKHWAKGLANAILRKIQKNREMILSTRSPEDTEAYYNHPEWLVTTLKQQYPDTFENILHANNERAPLTLRVNTTSTTRDHCLSVLQSMDIKAEPTEISPTGIRLADSINIKELSLFKDGLVSVQDEGAQLTIPLLVMASNMIVLDACAAPGGKSCHMLEACPSIRLYATDKDQDRCELINQNLQRLQQKAVVFEGDASKPIDWWSTRCDGQLFDKILVDAPCSATGVIRHHPDIKLLRHQEDIPAMANVQFEILVSLWPLLKPGGMLLYTTCSVLDEENDAVINRFVKKYQNAHIDKINAFWGLQRQYGRQLLPMSGRHDGFYFSRIMKS